MNLNRINLKQFYKTFWTKHIKNFWFKKIENEMCTESAWLLNF